MFSNPEGEAVGHAQSCPNPRDTGKGSEDRLQVATLLHAHSEECQDQVSVARISSHNEACPRKQSVGIRSQHNL